MPTNPIISMISKAQFIMLRYETEFTPCAGIAAVSKQERRYFADAVTIAPWCADLKRNTEIEDPLKNGKVKYTGWEFTAGGRTCKVLTTTDEFTPIFFIEIANCFLGKENPYDVELDELKKDVLYFGMAVDKILEATEFHDQFIWGADWESVPALYLARKKYIISLTLHNTFDQCLDNQTDAFGETYTVFRQKRRFSDQARTALEIGMELADVVTTVNRGFAYGMRNEVLQQKVMAGHLHPLLNKVVGIDNGPFEPLSKTLRELKDRLAQNFTAGEKAVRELKTQALSQLPDVIQAKAKDKVIIVSMGRRVAQKQHDVLVESVRNILETDSRVPLLAVFTTIEGDSGSHSRLDLINRLQKDFPANIVCLDGRVNYYPELMTAADYNCMPSLYEPHGGAYAGLVVPIARAVDGLAEQICALHPAGEAATINAKWHSQFEEPTGFLFRETYDRSAAELENELSSLLTINPSPQNYLFRQMRDSLQDVLRQAIDLRLNQSGEYFKLVLAVLKKQEISNWLTNLGGMLALIEQARMVRVRTKGG
jgi:glycogen synthase